MKKQNCYYENSKICSNTKCPIHFTPCPVPNTPGVCKYECRTGKTKPREVSKRIASIAVITVIILGIVALSSWIYKNNHEYTEREYSLVELSDGIYGNLTIVSSSIPAQNYSIVTLCCAGNVYTFKGYVEIKYSDTTKPYVKIHDYNIVNGDKIWLCVPQGTIEFQKGVGVG